MKVAFGFLVAIMMGLVAGCGSSAAGSCTTTAGSSMSCVDFGGSYTSSQVMQACMGSGTSYSASACTSTNRVGRCTIAAGGATSTTSYYSPLTASDVMTSCMMAGGTFEAN